MCKYMYNAQIYVYGLMKSFFKDVVALKWKEHVFVEHPNTLHKK